MLSWLKHKRSAGLRVTAATHRVLVRANAARDQRRWADAAHGYRQALAADPDLTHIWIQLGNMAKELGDIGEAERAYLEALRRRPGMAEVYLQLGHLFNTARDDARAGPYYLRAIQADPSLADAASGLHRALGRLKGPKRDAVLALLRSTFDDTAAAEPAQPVPDTNPSDQDAAILVFDVSDLIGYFSHNRLPTGIQRVQIQVVTHALLRPAASVRICCFVEGMDNWHEIRPAEFNNVVELSLQHANCNDTAWIAALHRLHLRLFLSPPFAFPTGATLVNLGSSWQLHNYFLLVREAKARHGIRYVPFVHDLIPIIAPEHFTEPARREVIPWVAGILAHADHFLTNSEATRNDLLHVAKTVGRPLDPRAVAVIRLDADFRPADVHTANVHTASGPLPGNALATWGLRQQPFVLLVSTVESRKGHATALEAWSTLIARHGAAAMPKLVCVGRKGWLNGPVYQRLEHDPVLASHVAMLSAVSDNDLAQLYRACLFTIYPSLYEGWGLPITEALCHGKPVITTYASALPEAGGEFAVYVAPGSAQELAAAVESMVLDVPYRQALAARIAATFRPRRWDDLAAQIEAELVRMAHASPPPGPLPPPMATLGAYHAIGRSRSLQLRPGTAFGEMFRSGIGWASPEFGHCATRADGGDLAIGIPAPHRGLRAGLLLIGADTIEIEWCLHIEHGAALTGSIGPAARKWVTFNVPDDIRTLRIHLQTVAGDEDPSEDEYLLSLAGFVIYAVDDTAAGSRPPEAIALDDPDAADASDASGLPDWPAC